jgi:hypothetical protein
VREFDEVQAGFLVRDGETLPADVFETAELECALELRVAGFAVGIQRGEAMGAAILSVFRSSIGDMYKVCVSEPADPCAKRDGLIIRVREDHDSLWEGSGITLGGGCSLQRVKGSQFRAHPEAELRALQLSFRGMRGD